MHVIDWLRIEHMHSLDPYIRYTMDVAVVRLDVLHGFPDACSGLVTGESGLQDGITDGLYGLVLRMDYRCACVTDSYVGSGTCIPDDSVTFGREHH